MKKKWCITTLAILPIVQVALNYRASNVNQNWHKQNDLAHISTKRINLDQYDASDWMSNLSDNRNLFSLSIPGTHDSAMYNGYGIYWFFGSLRAQTQVYSFQEQLKLGIRAFDLRSQNDGRLVHGPVTSYQTLDNAFYEYTKFLEKHPTEFILVRIKDENFNVRDNNYARQANSVYHDVLHKYEKFLYNTEGKSYNTLSRERGFNIQQYRGKIIVLNHWHHLVTTDLKGGYHFRELTVEQSIQDKYDGLSIDEKINLITKHFNKTSNKEYLEDNVYVNFMSMAAGWRPDNSSARINQRIVNYLNQHQELSTLGVVFADYPGPSLIQAIYKTNFNYTDKILDNDGLEKNVKDLSFSRIYDGDTEITLLISDNIEAYRGLNLEINIDDETLRRTIPNNFNSTKFVIKLDNKTLKQGQNLTIKSYKMTPNDGWYMQRKYNEINKTLEIEINDFIISRNNMINEVYSMIIDYSYNPDYSNIVDYLQRIFMTPLSKIRNGDNEKFAELNNNFNAIKEQLKTQLLVLNNIDDNLLHIEQRELNLNNFFTNENSEKIMNSKVNAISKIDNLFSNNNTYISGDDIDGLLTEITKNKQITSVAIETININKNVNIAEAKKQLNSVDSSFDFAKKYWVDELNTILTKPNYVISDIENLNNIDRINKAAEDFKNNFSSPMPNVVKNINLAVKNIEIIKEFFDTDENRTLLDKFTEDIIENIENLSSPDILKENVELYKEKLQTLKSSLKKAKQYLDENTVFSNKAMHTLKNTINDINNMFENQKRIEFNISYFETANNKIDTDIKHAMHSNNLYTEISEKIDENDDLFSEWKELLKEKLNHINDITDKSVEPIQNLISDLKNGDFNNKLNNLVHLSQAQKERMLTNIKSNIDINAINQSFVDFALVNAKMLELKDLVDEFSDFENLIGYKLLLDENKKELSNNIHLITQSINDDLNIEEIEQKISYLLNNKNIFNGDQIIADIDNLITNSTQLYSFQKNKFKDVLRTVDNYSKLQSLKKLIQLEEQNDLINNDKKLFKLLSTTQEENVLDALVNANSQDEYQQIKERTTELNNVVGNAIDLLSRISNIENDQRYINNFEENKQNLIDSIDVLKHIYLISQDSNQILNQIGEVEKKIELLYSESERYIQYQEKRQALQLYAETKNRLNDEKERLNNDQYIYNEIIAKINNLIDQSDLTISDGALTTTEINLANEKLNDYLLKINDLKIAAKNNYDKEQRRSNFANFYNVFYFTINDETKETILPSNIVASQLNKDNCDPNYLISDINLSANNDNGEITISYTISTTDNEFIDNKTQVITGLLTTSRVEEAKRIEQERQQLINSLQKSINDKLIFSKNNWNIEQIQDKINDFNTKLNHYYEQSNSSNLEPVQIDKISKQVADDFKSTKSFVDDFINHYLNNLINNTEFKIPKEKDITQIEISDITSNINDSNISLKIDRIEKNLQDSKIIIHFSLNYKNLNKNAEFEIKGFLPKPSLKPTKNSIAEENNKQTKSDQEQKFLDAQQNTEKSNIANESPHNNQIQKQNTEKSNIANESPRKHQHQNQNTKNNPILKQEQKSNKASFNKNYLWLLSIPIVGALIYGVIFFNSRSRKR
ncbi:hypothetical protein [Mycoplasma sp. HS2188]|uniref:hypothetical protein n=1 Tax=Mycoplasma sp. HS2188 TaxID=2976765 RepID=UPI0021AAF4B6|nr:hypothetical protein [Mycoplasma sp. HS2188]MCT4469633.1 hypothetical protein [Mycoplasma sp. HS2188]